MKPKARLRRRLCEEQGHRCCYCGIALVAAGLLPNAATLEHIVPACIGGRANYANTVVACRFCNFGRGTMRADSYLDLVCRFGRELAHGKGRRWQQRHGSGTPGGLREVALSQYGAAGYLAGVPKRYRERLACAMNVERAVHAFPDEGPVFASRQSRRM